MYDIDIDCTGRDLEGPRGTTDSICQMIVEDLQNLRHKGAGGGLTSPLDTVISLLCN